MKKELKEKTRKNKGIKKKMEKKNAKIKEKFFERDSEFKIFSCDLSALPC